METSLTTSGSPLDETPVPIAAAALFPSTARPMELIENHMAWPILARMPETLTALISVRRLTVSDLLSLQVGQMLSTDTALADDIPVKVGHVQLAWSEFEVVERTLAVRLTRFF